MAAEYFSLVTDLGAAKIAQAGVYNAKINITQFAIGDGGGIKVIPSKDMTALKNELWRGSINFCEISKESPNIIIVNSIIPSDIGGFTIREMGLFDNEGVLIAVGNTPDTQKIKLADGAVHELSLSMEIVLDNADSIELVVDPTVVCATREDLNNLKNELGIGTSGSTGVYSNNIEYQVGEYCIYNNILYKCTGDTQGDWDPGCWVQTNPMEEIKGLQKSIGSLEKLFKTDDEGNMKPLGAAAFAEIANNRTTTEAGFLADARQLKEIQDQLDEQNSALGNADKISDLLPLFKLEGKTQKVTTTASAWKTVQFIGFTIPTGYRTIMTSFNASNAGVVMVLSNESNNITYVRVYCESAIDVNITVNRIYANTAAF